MIATRRADDRFHTAIGWLDSRHTFAFGEHWDERFLGYRGLRVINDDIVKAGTGFGTHGHRDMEIITWILDGALEHKDSLGNGDVLRPGDAQRMSAGTGIRHSEFNPSRSEPVHLLQIWIEPDRAGHQPSYEQRHFPAEQRRDRWLTIAAGDGRDGSMRMHADAAVSTALLGAGKSLDYDLAPGRGAWLHVARGAVEVDGQRLVGGDGIALEDESLLRVTASGDSELLLFDLG